MKKLDRLILKSFLGPLLLTFSIAVFVLLMQFVWKYIDDMVGKGLDFIVIAKLLFYASATFVPMALPISVLFASIMTMGNFGEKYELVAMKAGGISLQRVMRPMVFVSLLLTGVAFYFANNVLPYAMLQYRTILYDVTRKKPAINIRPSEYYTDIENYVIRVNQKDPDGTTLHDITIYDHTHSTSERNVIIAADHGKMQSSADDRYLFFTLYDGCCYSEQSENENHYSRPFTRVEFHKQVITFDISSFAFNESDTKFFEGNYQMMNVKQLHETAGALLESSKKRAWNNKESMMAPFAGLKEVPVSKPVDSSAPPQLLGMNLSMSSTIDIAMQAHSIKSWDVEQGLKAVDPTLQRRVYNMASNSVRNQRDKAIMNQELMRGDMEYINRHIIEMHRKFTLSIACLLLFLVGAPFGSLVRKGGLGMPLVASVVFFVLYYVIGMICEKAVRESALPPIGMWVSSFVLLPIGIILTVQATTDRNLAIGQWFITLKEKRLQRKNKTQHT